MEKNCEPTEQLEQLVQRKICRVCHLDSLGFGEDETEQTEVKCKYCQKTVLVTKGNTTDFSQHFEHSDITMHGSVQITVVN